MYVKVKDPNLLHTIETVPCVQSKANWALKWCNFVNASFPELMIAFAAIKGIFFSCSYCAIFWLKKCGFKPGLSFSNELISHDEGLHCNFSHAWSTSNWSIIFLRHALLALLSVQSRSKWILVSMPSPSNSLGWIQWWYVQLCQVCRLVFILVCGKLLYLTVPFFISKCCT